MAREVILTSVMTLMRSTSALLTGILTGAVELLQEFISLPKNSSWLVHVIE